MGEIVLIRHSNAMNAAAAHAIKITSKSKNLGQNFCAVTERRIMRRERERERGE